MFAVVHTISGITLVSTPREPKKLTLSWPIMFCLTAFLLHFLLDALPHAHPKNFRLHPGAGQEGWEQWFIAADLLLSFVLGLIWLLQTRPVTWQVAAVIMTLLPDLEYAPGVIMPTWWRPFHYLHFTYHWSVTDAGRWWGIASQLLVVLLCLAILTWSQKRHSPLDNHRPSG